MVTLIFVLPEGECKRSASGNFQETNTLPEMLGFCHEMTNGFVAVIHNTYFPKRREVFRQGSEQDVEALRQFFECDVDFEFRVYEDLTADGILNKAKDLSEKDLSKWDSFFFFVLSHGQKEGVLGIDEKLVPVEAIVGIFTPDKCPSLINKPKVFMIQACRGDMDDFGAVASDSAAFVPPSQQILPIHSDFLVAYSSPPGYASFRNLENGSWFLQTLVKVFRDYFEKEHLMDMLLRVNYIIAKLSVGNMKQMPIQECTLTKKCFFYKQQQIEN